MRHGSAPPSGEGAPQAATGAEDDEPRPEAPAVDDPARISLYRGERRPGRRYRELWTGPGVERLLGAPVPPDVDPGQFVLDRIVPADRERVERLFSYEALLDVDSVETDYRLLGLDGEVRVVRDRGDVRDRDAERVIFSGSLVDVTAERRLAERLAGVERRVGAAAAAAGIALWEVTLDDEGRYVSADVVPNLDVLLGGALPSDDPAGAWLERVHPDDRAAFRAHLAALGTGERATLEYRLTGVDGRTRWIWTRAAGVRGPDGARVVGVSADVTERRRHDEDLLAHRRHVASLLETVRALLVTAEFDEDGAVVDLRRHGSVERFIGRPVPAGPAGLAAWIARVHPDDRERVKERMRELVSGLAADTTYRICHEDGGERLVRSHARRRIGTEGARTTVDVILLDVTEAERTAAALEETEQRLDHVLHAIDDAVYSVELEPDGRFGSLQANDRWYATFGRPTDDVTADTLFMEALHPADRAAVRAGNARLAAGESVEREYRVVDASGTERWLHDRAWPRRRATGPRVADGIQVDVTERRRIEEELHRSRAGATRRAAEETFLRELATAIALGRPADEVFALAALQATRLVDGTHGLVVRFDGDGTAVVAVHDRGRAAGVAEATSTRAADEVGRTGRPARHERPSTAAVAGGPPSRPTTRVAVPVRAGSRLWGAVSVDVASSSADWAEDRLADLAELVGLAVSETETRRLLAERALSDPLTGLANHRAFHEELETEVLRARRYDRRLSLVLLDVDHFKAINDSAGHPVGDATLQRVADLLRSLVRTGELVGRVGGDELALLLPETDAAGAAALAERARLALARDELRRSGVTLSAGVAELSAGGDADELYRQADRALLWTKRHGRDGVSRYDAGTMHDRAPDHDDDRLARSHARAGLHALARAVDLRESRLSGHADRVVALADRLADRLGWSSARRALLREAAFLHDVGKIGIPNGVLRAGSLLDPAARSSTRTHPVLGAQMAAEVLDEQQTSWIRHHHERWDGAGYPDGLRGAQIPDGATLLGLAEAWDAMTGTRPDAGRRTRADALAECRRQAGRQFAPEAVQALEAIEASGALPGPSDG